MRNEDPEDDLDRRYDFEEEGRVRRGNQVLVEGEQVDRTVEDEQIADEISLREGGVAHQPSVMIVRRADGGEGDPLQHEQEPEVEVHASVGVARAPGENTQQVRSPGHHDDGETGDEKRELR